MNNKTLFSNEEHLPICH